MRLVSDFNSRNGEHLLFDFERSVFAFILAFQDYLSPILPPDSDWSFPVVSGYLFSAKDSEEDYRKLSVCLVNLKRSTASFNNFVKNSRFALLDSHGLVRCVSDWYKTACDRIESVNLEELDQSGSELLDKSRQIFFEFRAELVGFNFLVDRYNLKFPNNPLDNVRLD
jgi:hypothetical protein